LLLLYFIAGKILKVFDKVLEKVDLVRNWAIVGEFSGKMSKKQTGNLGNG